MKLLIQISFPLLATLLSFELSSQFQCTAQIRVIAKDKLTAEPLFHSLSVRNEDGSLKFISIADTTILTSPCDSSAVIIISATGYREAMQNISTSKDTLVTCVLMRDVITLSQVEVVSQRPDQIKQSHFYLTPNETREQQGKNLGEMLERSTGVTMLKTGSNVMKPVIHGLHSNRLIIITNDSRLESQQWGSDHGVEFDSFQAHAVTIIKGPSALRYGHDALAGVVIISEKPLSNKKGLRGQINTLMRSNGRTLASNLMLEDHSSILRGLTVRAGLAYKLQGTLSTPTYRLANTGLRELNHHYLLNYSFKKHSIEFLHNRFNSNIGIYSNAHSGNLTDLIRLINQDSPIENTPFSYAIDRPSQLVLHELQRSKIHLSLSRGWNLELIHSRQFNQRQEFDKHRPKNDSIANLNIPELNLKLTTHQLSWILKKVLPNKNELSLGGQYSHQKNTFNGRFYIPNFIRNTYGIFIQATRQVGRMHIDAAARYDREDLQSFYFQNNILLQPTVSFQSPAASLNLSTRVTEKSDINIQLSTSWRAPGINELYSNGLHHGSASIEIGDATLKKERSFGIQANYHIHHDRLTVNAQPYTTYINHFIFGMPQQSPTLTIRGAYPTFRFEQTNAMLSGLDAAMEYQLTEKVQLNVAGSLLRARDITKQTFLTQMPADRISMRAEYYPQMKRNFHTAKVYFEIQRVGKQIRVPSNTDILAPPNAYTLLHAGASVNVTIHKHQVFFVIQVNNLLNTKYRDYLNRFRYFADETGRNISVSIQIPINSSKDETP